MSKLGGSKPKKQSLISNILNRVDNISLGVKKHKTGIMLKYYPITEKHTLANKELLSLLSYEEIEQVLNGDELYMEYDMNMFKFNIHTPEYVKPEKFKPAVVIKSYKEIDKIGTSKGEAEIFKKKTKK